jgi:murein DD-endopeptidase MepM/ murein hydrolase activator NlpD
LTLLIPAAATAKRIYTYTDENGIVHYTDKKPNTDLPVDSRVVKVDTKPAVTARRVDGSDESTYYFFNHWHGPVEIRVRIENAKNMVTIPNLPTRFVIQDFGETPLVVLQPKQKGQTWSYRLVYDAVPGDYRAKPDRSHLYRLPFRASDRFYLGQAFGGMATHTDKQSYHAVDITMPVGTPILATRDGIVMNVEEDYYGAGQKQKYATRANHVRILHEDGTMAIYAHMDLESVAVRAGRTVLAGELIGLSGNTGFSTGPHLHFAVQRNMNGELQSIPFNFDNGRGQALTPKAGTWLEAKR